MDDFDRKQFWDALGRLYDSTQELKERLDHLTAVTDSLGVSTGHIRDASANLVRVAEAHERRRDKVEVQTVGILDDLRRAKDAISRLEQRLEGGA